MNHLSCFTGLGGIDLAAERAGMTSVGQVEIDRQCRSVLRRHWPDVPRHEDIADGAVEFVRGLGRFDLLSGGCPCQGFSIAGRREGLADDRSGLFAEFLRLVAEFTPAWALVENVPGLLSSEHGEDLAAILGEWTGFWPAVPADGWRNSGVCTGPRYSVAWRVLDAQYFGVPQRRRRVFLVGRARNAGRPELPAQVLFEPESLCGDPPPRRQAGQGVAGAVADGVAEPLGFGGNNRTGPINVASALNHHSSGQRHDFSVETYIFEPRFARNGRGAPEPVCPPLKAESGQTGKGDQEAICFVQNSRDEVLQFGGNGQTCGALAAQPGSKQQNYLALCEGGHGVTEMPTTTALTGDGGKPGQGYQAIRSGYQIRRLTPTECERLQGLPDGHTAWGLDESGQRVDLADGPRYRMCGNSVAVPCVAWIMRRIAAAEGGPHA